MKDSKDLVPVVTSRNNIHVMSLSTVVLIHALSVINLNSYFVLYSAEQW